MSRSHPSLTIEIQRAIMDSISHSLNADLPVKIYLWPWADPCIYIHTVCGRSVRTVPSWLATSV